MSAASVANWEERELLPISALQHLTYCERRAALIHVDREWRENLFTAEGRVGHARVDGLGARRERRGDVMIGRRVALWSRRLGLNGIADVVEYRSDIVAGAEVPIPVEYKRGRLRHERAFDIQLCAQGLCLEEMSGASIPHGAIMFIKARKRRIVVFDEALRAETVSAVERLRALIRDQRLPRAQFGPKCRHCSMRPVCMPELTDGSRSAAAYLTDAISEC